MLIDTHCHLDFPEFDQDRDDVVNRAKKEGISYIINIGSSIDGSKRSIELASKYDNIYASVGVHPHDADNSINDAKEKILEFSKHDRVVAIGEIGLDYYKNYSSQDNQRKLFLLLLDVAKQRGLPLVIHTRQAESDTLKILNGFMPIRAVVHCFSGDNNFLQECLRMGFLVSFTCNITYKKAQDLREIVKLVPIEKILLETDAPYLSPEGMRGKRNEPVNIKRLAQEISVLKGVGLDEVARVTTENAKSFFGIQI